MNPFHWIKKIRDLILFLLAIYFPISLFSQQTSPNTYFIQFTDKSNSPYSVNNPSAFLSQRALNRRQKHHVQVTTEDLPVNKSYLDSLRAKGARVLFTTKWLNGATVSVDTVMIINNILKLSFVKPFSTVIKSTRENGSSLKSHHSAIQTVNSDTIYNYGSSLRQINISHGDYLHSLGYRGQGILIAVIDDGFYHVDSLKAFANLFKNHQIKATYNFEKGTDSVYNEDMHGMAVLSDIAGQLPGKLIGTAPNADFLLLRSEVASSEFLWEEDAWVAAAEFADSAGADIITSSLGYSTFDSSFMNHTYQDMSGHTTRVSIGANKAFSKGILVVVSAGNEGNKPWKYISTPGDADSVLTVGAIDTSGVLASFSSRGPNSSGEIKPDVMAVGLKTVIASTDDGEISAASGTSLSCPLISGMAASLMSAFPAKTCSQIKQVIEQSSSLYYDTNNNMGYGIPNFELAYEIFTLINEPRLADYNDFKLLEYPDPFIENFGIDVYSRANQKIQITITDILGQTVLERSYILTDGSLNKITISLKSITLNGLFFLYITNGRQSIKQKIIKL